MPKWFKPLRSKPKRRELLGFDIEGVGGPDGFVCGAVVGDYIYQFYTNREQMFNDLLAYAQDGFWPFAHNLQYDLPVLEGPEFPKGELIFTRFSLLWAKYGRGRSSARLLDSVHLFPRHSVAAMGSILNLPKLELDPGVLTRLSRGYNFTSFNEIDQESIRRYVLRDAEIVFLAISQLQEILLAEGGQLRPTIAGCAMDLFRRVYLGRPWPVLGPKTNELVRPAYYGGRVENFKMGRVQSVNMYDITSLYPSVQQATRFPHPRYLKLEVNPRTSHKWLNLEGVAACTVEQPEKFVPSLPFRYNKRLFFPNGELTGMWTLTELRAALDLGAKLKAVEFVLYSDVLFNPFSEYIERLFSRRQWYMERGSGYANLVKLLLNSLYGRWGLNPTRSLFRLVDLEGVDDFEAIEGYHTQDHEGKLLAYGPLQSENYPDYVNVMIAAQVSSAARLELLTELNRQGEGMAYCDTDSVITSGLVQTRDGLGGWRAQMIGGEADLISPKEYILHNLVTDPEYIAKGVPALVAAQYLKTGAARFMRAVGIREAYNNHLTPSTWIETFRSHNPAIMKRFPERLGDLTSGGYTLTRPYLARELPEVCLGGFLPPDFRYDRLEKVSRLEYEGVQSSFL